MGPGVNPHSYQAKISDIDAISQAYNRYFTTVWISKRKSKTSWRGRETAASPWAGLCLQDRLIPWDGEEKLYDPHIWNDMDLWWEALKSAGK
jgi:manganese/zinc/iron transport system substrate-binding protein